MSKSRSFYLNDNKGLKRSQKSSTGAAIAALLAVFAMVLGVISLSPMSAMVGGSPVVNNVSAEEEDGALQVLCSSATELGGGMSQGEWNDRIFAAAQADAPNRTWTLQEAFGANMKFVNYNGEGAGGTLIRNLPTDRGAEFSGWASALPKLEEARSKCIGGGIVTGVASGGLAIANSVSKLAQTVAVYAFDSGFICEDPANPGKACINLLKVIGGGAGTDGIITALTNSVYLPLLIMIVTITGLWVLWTGIVKRRYREALFGALWVMMAAIIGFTLLLKPAMIVKAPMAVSNAIVGCVVGAFNGQNCFDGSTSSSLESTSKDICKSDASVTLDGRASLAVNSLTCSIWKAFVLEPYSVGNFGRSFDDLDITNSEVSAAAKAAEVDPNKFCVNLVSANSVNDMPNRMVMNGSSQKVCNLAAYQMFLSTNAASGPDSSSNASTKTASTPDTRWYNLILTVANDDGMWEKWAPGTNRGTSLIGVSAITVVSSLAGSFVIIVIALFALIYYLTTIIMFAFAPIFLLLGVHPGKGKKLLIGWFETILSNFIKYLFSAVFLLVTIAFYAAVLGSSSGVGTTFIFVLILTGALLMYRNELMGLIGRVNMGGEKLSNSASQWVQKKSDKGKRIASATAGAAIGTAVASGATFNPKDIARNTKAAAIGGWDGAKREMKVGSGVVSNAFRQSDRLAQDNKRDLAATAKQAQSQTAEKQTELTAVKERVLSDSTDVAQKEAEYTATSANLSASNDDEKAARGIEASVIAEMSGENPEIAQMMEIINQMRNLKLDAKIARAGGDQVKAAAIDARIRDLQVDKRELQDGIDREDFDNFSREYNDEVDEQTKRAGLSDHMDNRSDGSYVKESIDHARIEAEYIASHAEYTKSLEDHMIAQQEYNQADIVSKRLGKAHKDLVPGEGLTTSRAKKLENQALKKVDKENNKLDYDQAPALKSFDTSIEESSVGPKSPTDVPLPIPLSLRETDENPDMESDPNAPISQEPSQQLPEGDSPRREAEQQLRPLPNIASPLQAKEMSNTDLNKLVDEYGDRLSEGDKIALQDKLNIAETSGDKLDKDSTKLVEQMISAKDAEAKIERDEQAYLDNRVEEHKLDAIPPRRGEGPLAADSKLIEREPVSPVDGKLPDFEQSSLNPTKQEPQVKNAEPVVPNPIDKKAVDSNNSEIRPTSENKPVDRKPIDIGAESKAKIDAQVNAENKAGNKPVDAINAEPDTSLSDAENAYLAQRREETSKLNAPASSTGNNIPTSDRNPIDRKTSPANPTVKNSPVTEKPTVLDDRDKARLNTQADSETPLPDFGSRDEITESSLANAEEAYLAQRRQANQQKADPVQSRPQAGNRNPAPSSKPVVDNRPVAESISLDDRAKSRLDAQADSETPLPDFGSRDEITESSLANAEEAYLNERRESNQRRQNPAEPARNRQQGNRNPNPQKPVTDNRPVAEPISLDDRAKARLDAQADAEMPLPDFGSRDEITESSLANAEEAYLAQRRQANQQKADPVRPRQQTGNRNPAPSPKPVVDNRPVAEPIGIDDRAKARLDAQVEEEIKSSRQVDSDSLKVTDESLTKAENDYLEERRRKLTSSSPRSEKANPRRDSSIPVPPVERKTAANNTGLSSSDRKRIDDQVARESREGSARDADFDAKNDEKVSKAEENYLRESSEAANRNRESERSGRASDRKPTNSNSMPDRKAEKVDPVELSSQDKARLDAQAKKEAERRSAESRSSRNKAKGQSEEDYLERSRKAAEMTEKTKARIAQDEKDKGKLPDLADFNKTEDESSSDNGSRTRSDSGNSRREEKRTSPQSQSRESANKETRENRGQRASQTDNKGREKPSNQDLLRGKVSEQGLDSNPEEKTAKKGFFRRK